MQFLLPRFLRERQAFLATHFDVVEKFEALEETCIPSYLHKNPAASWVAWSRLLLARRLFKKFTKGSKVLDFGAGSGELCHLLSNLHVDYSFAEIDSAMAAFISKTYPHAKHVDIRNDEKKYDAIFALDSLEHNENYAALLAHLRARLNEDGILILSGPTENWLYRLGRKISGFSGHYHHTTIYDIEAACSKYMQLVKVKTSPFGVPLFRVSVWKKNDTPA